MATALVACSGLKHAAPTITPICVVVVIINRLGSCGLVPASKKKARSPPARPCRRHVDCGLDARKARTVRASGHARSPPANGATQLPAS